MKRINLILSIATGFAFYLLPLTTTAQDKTTTYMLPGNKVIPAEKIDSVAAAWGGLERLGFEHSHEDDKNNIMHLRRITDQEMKEAAEIKARRAQAQRDMVDQPAPEWTATDINGNKLSLQDLKGKVVVMNFWFTTCSPCIREMPHLNKLTEKYKGKEVVFIAFARNDEAGVRAFLQKRPFNYLQFPDSKTVDESYAIDTWPTSFVIGKDGKVRLVINYNEDIEQLLSGAIEATL